MRPRRIRRGEQALRRKSYDTVSAASMRPRRIRRGEQGQHERPAVGDEASMRPRRIRRGEPRTPIGGRSTGTPGFNAATANSPWRTPAADVRKFLAAYALQCGHGEFAV